MIKILMATGQDVINKVISANPEYTMSGIATHRSEIRDIIKDRNPNTIMIGKNLPGMEPINEIIKDIIIEHPEIRIIYLVGQVDMTDEDSVDELADLAMRGVYDLILTNKLKRNDLYHAIDDEKTEEDVRFIIEKSSKFATEEIIDSEIMLEEIEETEERKADTMDNLFVISSIKPGTGKSFLSSNIATAIAQFGVRKADGQRPNVAIVEGDLQNLSIGTLLQVEDDKKNLKHALDKIATIIDKDGTVIGDVVEKEEVLREIKKSFVPYSKVKNLHCLVGSQFEFEDVEDVSMHHFAFLIDAIADEFDVIIVDSNSALTHVTSVPLLIKSKKIYYVINLDFNNIRNNKRYQTTLNNLEVGQKVGYILNEDMPKKVEGEGEEELLFHAEHLEDAGFQLEAKVPAITKSVFLNRLFSGTPIVLDRESTTEAARNEILKVANQIYPIEGLGMKEESAVVDKPKKKGLFKGKKNQ